jgi:hypothetical protein
MPPKFRVRMTKDLRIILKKAAERALKAYKAARFKQANILWLYQKVKRQRQEKKSDFAEKKTRLMTHYPNETLDGDISTDDSDSVSGSELPCEEVWVPQCAKSSFKGRALKALEGP